MGDPITFIIWLIVLALVCYILFWVLGQIPMPAPVRVMITVVVALVILVYLLQRSGLMAL